MKKDNPHLRQSQGMVYAANSVGHRHEYLQLLANIFKLKPISGQISWKVLVTLVRSPRLLFATLDDHLPTFVIVSIIRAIIGRKTTALFLRPQSCFTGNRLKHFTKLYIFKAIRHLRGLTIATITPFGVEPRYVRVAHHGLSDPQLWDLNDGTSLNAPPNTELSIKIHKAASGRPVLCFIGYLDLNKGFGFLTEMLRRNPKITDDCLVLAAGISLPHSRETARTFETSGGMLVDRQIDTNELLSLYGVADLVWCCYAPDYDQASGIFGRALQFGKPVLLRKNSLVERLATELDAKYTPIGWEDFNALERAVLDLKIVRNPPHLSAKYTSQILTLRKTFIRVIGESIDSAK